MCNFVRRCYWPPVEPADRAGSLRKRLVSFICLTAGGLGALSGLATLFSGEAWMFSARLYGAAAPLMFLALPVFRATAISVRALARVLVALLFFHILAVACLADGALSLAAVYLVAVPLAAVLLDGRRTGTIAAAAVIAAYIWLGRGVLDGWLAATLAILTINATLAIGFFAGEMRRLNASLTSARDEAQMAGDAKEAFLANMSHELRTPMNGIIGLAEALGKQDIDHKCHRYADTIARSGKALLAIINDVLDFSKLEAGMFDLDAAPFDLTAAVHDVVSLLERSAAHKGVSLETQFAAGLPRYFVGDVGRLRQVLTNIAGNAVKFTEDGYVRISVDGDVADDCADLTISVEDTGVGIPPEVQDRIFDRFARGDASVAARYGGTGLGLSITKGIIAAMGGAITLESNPGRGSLFTVRLNLAIAPPPAAALPAPQAASAARAPRRVLVVDDNDVNRLVIEKLLDTERYRPIFVGDGESALELVGGVDFDVILMDVTMPGMSGVEAVRHIRRMEAEADRPQAVIIALTAHAAPSDHAAFRAAGMNDVLTKPVQRADLDAMLEKWTAAPRPAAAMAV